MEEASRGWTSYFISSHSSEAGWSLGQGSRTSKAQDEDGFSSLACGKVHC